VIHRPRAAAALLVAVMLSAAAPAASVAAATPLDTNLLRNSGFETLRTDGTIAGWTLKGSAHAEQFGDRAWPYPAYGKKYKGGKRYLACGTGAGLVSQTVAVDGLSGHSKARLQIDFGGVTDHRIRISIRASGSGHQDKYVEHLKVMDVTNHYKVIVTSLPLPAWVDHVQATIELMPKAGSTRCKMVGDSTKLTLQRT
jgi:hypothetical protein